MYDGGVLPSIMASPSDYSPIPRGYPISDTRVAVYQEEVVRWLSDFLYTGPRASFPFLRFAFLSFTTLIGYLSIELVFLQVRVLFQLL